MKASLSFSAVELDSLARSFLPLHIDLSNPEQGTRGISVKTLDSVELAPHQGIRLVGTADVEWTVLGIRVPASVDDLSVLVHMTLSAERLEFRFEIERGDVKHLPGLIEGTLAARINESLRAEAAIPAFRFGSLLEREIKLPEWLTPKRQLILSSAVGDLSIDNEQLTLTVDVDMRGKLDEVGEMSVPSEEASAREAPQPIPYSASADYGRT